VEEALWGPVQEKERPSEGGHNLALRVALFRVEGGGRLVKKNNTPGGQGLKEVGKPPYGRTVKEYATF